VTVFRQSGFEIIKHFQFDARNECTYIEGSVSVASH